jgi:hypothetical protein
VRLHAWLGLRWLLRERRGLRDARLRERRWLLLGRWRGPGGLAGGLRWLRGLLVSRR